MCYVDISDSKATDSRCMAGKVRDAWGIVPFCNNGRKWSFQLCVWRATIKSPQKTLQVPAFELT